MFFDICVIDTRKPLFHRSEDAFYFHDPEAKEYQDLKKVMSHEEIDAFENKIYC